MPSLTGQRPARAQEKDFTAGVMACLPTLLGYLAVGITCGALGKVVGLTFWQVAIAAVFIYSGSAQFLLYSMIQQHSGMVSMLIAMGFINLRFLLINTYLAQFFKDAGKAEKLIGGLLISDETFGLASTYASKYGKLHFAWLLGLNLTAWTGWSGSVMAGYLFATSLPRWFLNDLSFSLVGMFVGLLLLGFFASSTKMLDIFVIAVSMALVFAGHYCLLPDNALMMGAPIITATLAVLLLHQLRRRYAAAAAAHEAAASKLNAAQEIEDKGLEK